MGRRRKHNAGELCEECGLNEKQFKGYSKNGEPLYRKVCQPCHRGKYRTPWTRHKGTCCEMCGFEPLWRRTLEVHHRDGDNSNNELSNFMTLCANCHRELEATIFHKAGLWEEAEAWFKEHVMSLFK